MIEVIAVEGVTVNGVTPTQTSVGLTNDTNVPGKSNPRYLYHFPDEVNVPELNFMSQNVWSTTFYLLPSQQRRQRRRLSSFGVGFKGMQFVF